MRGFASRFVVSWVALFLFAPGAAALPLAQDPAAAAQMRFARLDEIAGQLQDPQSDAVALFTEAARLAGFVLWNEDRVELAAPTGEPRLFLAVTDAEIRDSCELFRAGNMVARDDLLAGVDGLYTTIGIPGAVAPHALAFFRDGGGAANPSARALHFLLDALGKKRGGSGLDDAADFDLDPLQSLLVLRVLTEDIGVPLRRHLAAGATVGEPKKGPYGSDDAPALADAPGWAEDAYVGGITGLFGEVVEGIGKFGSSIKEGAGKANAIATIAKFVTTYTFLKGETRVEAPGQPLVRTKDTSPGERRTLVAHFWIDGSKVTDWLKEHRQLTALAGLDLDMPHSGALKGMETEWDLKQDRYSSKGHLVQTVAGQPDISKIKTDDNGEARIEVEGTPQARKLDGLKVMPVEKSVRVTVTPQVKSTEMQQDLVDAVTGAIGIKDGGVGFLTPVIECLYRMKWKGGRWFDLKIRDWTPAETIGQAEISIQANGSDFGRTWSHKASVMRHAQFRDLAMQANGVEVPPELDPKMVAMMPKQVREQMELGRQQMLAMAKFRYFVGQAPGQFAFERHDSEYGRGIGDGCAAEDDEFWNSWNGTANEEVTDRRGTFEHGNLYIECDLEKKTAKLRFGAAAEVDVVRREKNGRSSPREVATKENSGVFDGLRLDPPYTAQQIEMPLQESPGSEPGIVNYYGVVTVPFHFGMGDRFAGKAIVSWSVTRRLPAKK